MPTKAELKAANELMEIRIKGLSESVATHRDVINDGFVNIVKMQSSYEEKMTRATECFDTAKQMLFPDAKNGRDTDPAFRAFERVMGIFSRPEDIEARKDK